jgi:hypothetical protein
MLNCCIRGARIAPSFKTWRSYLAFTLTKACNQTITASRRLTTSYNKKIEGDSSLTSSGQRTYNLLHRAKEIAHLGKY